MHLVELIKVGGAGGLKRLNSLLPPLSINSYIACIVSMTVSKSVRVGEGKKKTFVPVDISNCCSLI